MWATIICSILVIFVIWCAIENQEVAILICGNMIVGIILFVSLFFGYKKVPNKKEEIVYKLQYEYSDETIKEAEDYNSEVKFGNNYWCRFSLRNEDLIDIDYYKNEGPLKNKILEILYDTKEDSNYYLKLQDCSNISVNKETETELILIFGSSYTLSKSEISLHILKENNLIYLTKDSIDTDIDEVENKVYSFIKEQIEAENLYWHTNTGETIPSLDNIKGE